MDDNWILVTVFVVGGATSLYRWLRSRSFSARRRALESRRTEIRRAGEGPVRIEGKIACDPPLLTAPISGQPCIFYDLLIEISTAMGDAATDPVLHEVRGLAFTVDDGTGTARVEFQDTGKGIPLREGPRHVTCFVDRVVLVDGTATKPQAATIDALVVEHGLGRRGAGIAPNRSWRVSEGIVRPGDLVSVSGRGSREITATGFSPDYRTPPSQYLLRAAELAPVTIVKLRS